MLSLADAHTQVTYLCEPSLDPVLNPEEIDAAILRTALASIWLPSTAYSEGQRVVPPIPMGRVFIYVLAGVSGTTEPPWLIAPAYDGSINPLAGGGGWWGVGVVPFIENVSSTPWFWGAQDGTAAIRNYGAFGGEIYDVRGAASSLWELKAARVSNRVDKRVGDFSESRSQMYNFCMRQAAALRPLRIV